jgi:nucleoside-diphosphate-sugar epimerase
MPNDLVLITGSTGHIGYQILLHALRAGYHVRAAIRSPSKADTLLSAPSLAALSPSKEQLSFVTVPDLLAEGAYDEAIKGVKYAIHVASPLRDNVKPGDDEEEVLIRPAIEGTLSILKSAERESSVQKVIITSSIAAIHDMIAPDPNRIYKSSDRRRSGFPTAPYPNTAVAYLVSKTLALNATEDWLDEHKPKFDVVHIYPSYVTTHNELVTDVEGAYHGSNRVVMGAITGQELGGVTGASVHLDDVAAAHVAALNPSLKGRRDFIVNSEGLRGTRWEEAWGYLERDPKFKEAIEKGWLIKGHIKAVPIQIDASETERVLGIKFKSFEEQVKSVASGYVALKEKEL